MSKLYTEEQVRKAIDFFIADELKKDKILKTLTPIELPTDEEIEKNSFDRLTLATQISGFQLGAQWMRDKIKGGNK